VVNQAYAVDALSDTVSQLQNELNITQDNVCSLANTQDQMLAQPEAYSTHYVPSVVSASTATTPSGLAHSAVDNRLDKMEGLIQQLVQHQLQGTQSTSNCNNPRNGRGTIRSDPNGP